MIFVPDTHALVWYVTADKRLGKHAKAALASVDEGAHQAVISVALKYRATLLSQDSVFDNVKSTEIIW